MIKVEKDGTKPGREDFNAMMQFIEEYPEPLGILCWKIDRLARNPIDEGALKYAFMKGKINHILANDRQFREGENQILMGVEFSAATQYSIELGKNVTRGMGSKVTVGWRPTLAPLGYLNDPTGLKGAREIFIDPARWHKLKEAWEMLLTGAYTVPQILKYLNEELGLRTKDGLKLSSSSLYGIFTNMFYTGYYEWNGEMEKGEHKPMITLEEFDMAQVVLGRKGKPRNQKHESAYTGVIRCAECGCMITAEPPKYKKNKGNGKIHVYHYLRCTKKNLNKKCSQKYVRVENLEEQIEKELQSIEIPEAYLKWAFKKLQKENKVKSKEFSVRRGQIQKEYNQNEGMLENLADDLARRTIDNETYKSCRERYQKKRVQLKKEDLDRLIPAWSTWRESNPRHQLGRLG